MSNILTYAFLVVCFYQLTKCTNGQTNGCTTYKVVAGDYQHKIANKVCKTSVGCKTNGYPIVTNANGDKCPSLIFVDEEVQVCCSKPNPGNSCKDYTVVKGDYEHKIVNSECQTTVGCIKDGFPTLKNSTGDHCPELILVGEKVQVCCSETPSTPTPTPTAGGSECPSLRQVKPTDSVFLTIDDGPSMGSREHLVAVLKNTNVKVTFFECGYNLCNDLDNGICAKSAYTENVKKLAEAVKDGHMLAAHSDNHYYDPVNDVCSYVTKKPEVRPPERLRRCSSSPIQNMVQGAHQVQLALESNLVSWNSASEIALKNKAINDVWTYARLPCSDIWRTRTIKETNLPGVQDQKEINLRSSIADDMFAGNVVCRPNKYNGIPWELYGFDPNVDWKGDKILEPGEKCRLVRLIEENMESETNVEKIGKLVLLTHDYFFNSLQKATVFKEVALELKRKGYLLKTMDKYYSNS